MSGITMEPNPNYRVEVEDDALAKALARIAELEAVLLRIAALDPEGKRADDLGMATRIARAALPS